MGLVLKRQIPEDGTVAPYKYCPNDPAVVKEAINECTFDGVTRIVLGDAGKVVGVVVVEGEDVKLYSNDMKLMRGTY